MDLELMFTEQKWNILKAISSEKLSPIQLSERLGTTMANISQQLRLLEASNLVKKEKVRNRDKGKPRTLFSLSDEFAYIIPAAANFTGKKLLKMTEHKKAILKIWFLENSELHVPLEKMYWKLESQMKHVYAIVVNQESCEALVVSDKPMEAEKGPKLSVRPSSFENALRDFRSARGFFSSPNLSFIYDRGAFRK